MLGLFYDNYLSFGHHRVSFGIADDVFDSHILAIKGHLVETPFTFLKYVLLDEFSDPVDIVGFFPMKEVNGTDLSLAYVLYDLFYIIHPKKNHQICAMQALNFPNYGFRLKSSENKIHIFDVIRKKFVVLQPEEWVRQHVLHYLMEDKKYPKSLINVEKQLTVNTIKKRYDVVIYDSRGQIDLLVECKAPSVNIDQQVFDQIARYNMKLNAQLLMVTNGIDHYYCRMDYAQEKYDFIKDVPEFSR